LRFRDIQRRFGAKFLSQVRAAQGSASLTKMTFDLTGVTLPTVSVVGLAMWAASILPDNRLDWRFVDFGLGLMETIDILVGEAVPADCPYVELFASVAAIVPQQRGYQKSGGGERPPIFYGYQISGGVGVLAAFDCVRLQLVEGKLGTCSVEVALSFAICVIGFTELCERLRIAPESAFDNEAVRRAKTLGIFPGPQSDLVYTLVGRVADRSDLSAEFRRYINDWRSKKQRMFAPTTRTEYLDHKLAFAGLKESVEL
jgi:hypothetical protein